MPSELVTSCALCIVYGVVVQRQPSGALSQIVRLLTIFYAPSSLHVTRTETSRYIPDGGSLLNWASKLALQPRAPSLLACLTCFF